MNTFALLAMHPDIQEKLFQEIRSVVAGQDDDVTKEDLNNMPYLDAFLKEVFRFFPVVPVLTRIIKKDIQIGSCSFTFHRNSVILMYLFSFQMTLQYQKAPK